MSITYTFDPESGVLRTRCEGDISLEDTLEHFDRVASDPKIPRGCKALLDVSQIGALPDTSQVRGAAEALDRSPHTRMTWGPWAIVADRDAVYGMSRMLQVFLEGIGIQSQVFRSADEAERWLASSEGPAD